MKFFADTANHEELDYCFKNHINDGITTNPLIMKNAGVSNFEEGCKAILEKYPEVPVSLETDLRGLKVANLSNQVQETRDVLLEQAHALAKLKDNVVIKIPISEGGLQATKILSQEGIKTNVTACMTPFQALEAAKAGATYVSLFANRMLDTYILNFATDDLNSVKIGDPSWKAKVKEHKEVHFEKAWEATIKDISYVSEELEKGRTEGRYKSELIVGSIRSPEDITRLAKAQPDILTIPFGIVKQMKDIENIKKPIERDSQKAELGLQTLEHPITLYTLQEFEDAADSYRNS